MKSSLLLLSQGHPLRSLRSNYLRSKYGKRPFGRGMGLLSASAVFAALFGGCSLSKIVDVKVGACPKNDAEGDRYCREILNPEEGNYPECASYECVPFGDYFQCQAIEEEICDGEDNDCDYLVDEPAGSSKTPNLEWVSVPVEDGIAAVSTATLTSSSGFGDVLYVQSTDAVTSLSFSGEGVSTETVDLYTQALSPDETSDTAPKSKTKLATLEEGCFPTVAGNASGACSLNDARVAAGDNIGFFAYVNSTGCRTGELRVGAIDATSPNEFVDRGLGFRDPTYRGVQTLGSACSSNLTEACIEAKQQGDDTVDVCGVSHPAISALSNQALVTYLGTPFDASSCPTQEANVLGLVLHERISPGQSAPFVWSDPSGDGEPQILAKTLSGDAPGLVALKEKGFLVGTGDADGDIRLTWVPKQDEPPLNPGDQCPADGCDTREVHTEAVLGIEEWEVVKTGTAEIADSIRFSILDLNDDEDDDDEILLLVSWINGCALDGGKPSASFRVLKVNLSDELPVLLESYPTFDLGKTSRPPLSFPAASPFVVPGLERSGETADERTSGGFYVLTQDAGMRLVRVAALDGKPVHKDEVLRGTDASEIYLVGGGAEDAFLSYSADDNAVLENEVTCD